ncbi:MAG: 5'-nucleotidase C-terminal domain-containing protein [Treponema sp.]|nr:5'-nucleotidase C-terminal domain-containing protein [Treponema sp.]
MKRIALVVAMGLFCVLGNGFLSASPMSEEELSRRYQKRQQELEAQAAAKAAAEEAARQAQAAKEAEEAEAAAIAAAEAEAEAKRVKPTGTVVPGKTYELILLHTNDHHGTVLPNNGRGGLAERATMVKIAKTIFPQVLLMDAGDMNTGSALSNMFDAEPDILAYNMMGYEVGVLGNHEFDGTLEKLLKQGQQVEFPIVTSNLKTPDGNYLGYPYILKAYDGFTVGVFGITTLRTKVIASPDPDIVFVDEIEAAKEIVDILKNQEKADIIIGLTHLGDKQESPDHVTSLELAAAVPGIDIIVDGHAHSYFDVARKLGNTYIVTANEWGKYLGAGRLSVIDRQLIGFDWMPIPIGPDPEVSTALAPYITKANESLKEIVGAAAETFEFGDRLTRKQETALGNAICDANVWYFQTVYGQEVDFAFHNGGNMRTELPAGDVTREQILTILPFENYLYIASLKGSQIIELFEFIASIHQGAGGWAQVSKEVRYTIDYTSGTGQLQDLTIHGEPVDPDRVYRFCTNDYLLNGGDGYTILTQAEEPFNTSLLLSYVFIEWIKAAEDSIVPETDGRITVISAEE